MRYKQIIFVHVHFHLVWSGIRQGLALAEPVLLRLRCGCSVVTVVDCVTLCACVLSFGGCCASGRTVGLEP